MKNTIIFIALATALFGQNTANEVNPNAVAVFGSSRLLEMSQSTVFVLAAGKGNIAINLKTGQVDLPKDMTLPDAAVAFWMRVAQAFPEVRRAIITGDPTPKTIMWGEDFAKKHPSILPRGTTAPKYRIISIQPGDGTEYELGLRSDGVVVWRELK